MQKNERANKKKKKKIIKTLSSFVSFFITTCPFVFFLSSRLLNKKKNVYSCVWCQKNIYNFNFICAGMPASKKNMIRIRRKGKFVHFNFKLYARLQLHFCFGALEEDGHLIRLFWPKFFRAFGFFISLDIWFYFYSLQDILRVLNKLFYIDYSPTTPIGF